MSLVFNQKELEDLKPYVDKAVKRFVGLSEPSVVNAAISLLESGADKDQFAIKISAAHPSLTERAHKLTETIFEMATEFAQSLQQHQKAKKRASSDGVEGMGGKTSKKEEIEPQTPTPSPGQLSAIQIQQMMADAKKMIQARKQALEAKGILQPTPAPPIPSVKTGMIPSMPLPTRAPQMPRPPASVPTGPLVPNLIMPAPQVFVNEESFYIPPSVLSSPYAFGSDKKKKIAELQAQIASKLAEGGFRPDIEDTSKPIPLLLDNEGRAIDVSGKQLLFPTRQPTLKANIRAQKKIEKGPSKQEEAAAAAAAAAGHHDEPQNKYFDERLAPQAALKNVERKKKSLKFNDPGKYVVLANKQRAQAKLTRLKNEIEEKARKTGISTAARLAKLSGAAAGVEKAEYIPQVEWWDQIILEEKDEAITYDSPLKRDAITNLIEHPTQIKPPTEPNEAPSVVTFLTKKERKKLRRQNRRETYKEKQEKIRLGLEPPPPPKVRISNLMRVLGVEAVQDPTKVEAHVRQQMAKRLKTHEETNKARKLTPEQRKAKKARKMMENTSLGACVSVYRIDCLGNQAKRFKVDTVARQLHMTGIVVMYRECNIVVVEGGPKQQAKYRRLIMERIKWGEDFVRDKEGVPNKCVLVWEGMVKERSFPDFKFKPLKTEDLVRDFFKKHGVQHYWDAALSGTVLEAVMEPE